MYPLPCEVIEELIVDLSGVERLASSEVAKALCSMFDNLTIWTVGIKKTKIRHLKNFCLQEKGDKPGRINGSWYLTMLAITSTIACYC